MAAIFNNEWQNSFTLYGLLDCFYITGAVQPAVPEGRGAVCKHPRPM